MAQANVVLPAPNGKLTEELMGLAIHKLSQLGTIEGDEIGVYTADVPEGRPPGFYFEFRANIIPYLGRR
ncbi:hypothetical protein SEA_LAKES_45 [Mycobacterium phage Lakes]|uniref:Gene 42 protein n=7 Tax=root TaxID=1 RepID=VG42_BPMD2|nr:hypothetical protein PBI_D29_42 [Mycobacterium phage D29]YP_008058312.1 hypothetical protein M178_gp38 [Mycobacterium phage Chy5]YP_008060199.1 hypothetical protein M179_gp39 [Mycobacterium phage Chy4]O64233.1 RecName: Full=Gene 42 protein; AltName: Full=Gp42 [Fromanvirus D29]AGK85806.1 hypothetical protein Chy1_0039 [Mycobacterium phage Chy1]QFG08808.1 hypothetical protein SEA_NAJI_45 [Mycobacterium phage Naji]QJD52428.1 hypothetical protein PBI_D32_45 [Mycobacterium phage D32]QUE25998.1